MTQREEEKSCEEEGREAKRRERREEEGKRRGREEKRRRSREEGEGSKNKRKKKISICFWVKGREEKRSAAIHLLLGQEKSREVMRREEILGLGFTVQSLRCFNAYTDWGLVGGC